MDIEETLASPGFWLLGGGAVAATMIGYIWSKKQEWVALPLWQLIILIIVELLAAAFFAAQE